MRDVKYRDLSKEDYERIKELICTAFGFNEFIKDKDVLDKVLTIYLEGCILDSTFSKVCVKDNKVIGIILGKAKGDPSKIKKFHNSFNYLTTLIKLIFINKENKKLIKEFSKVTETYKEIIKGKEDSFDGCIQLFIVSEESRGLGVGKALVKSLLQYMDKMNVKSLYLYTDTRCNYGFYDSQNFKRINEKRIAFEGANADLDVFLYSYKLV